MIGSEHVRRTADACVGFLRPLVEEDWTLRVPDLEMSVGRVLAHAAEVCLWYAIDLAAAGRDLQPVEHRVKDDVGNAAIVDTLAAYAFVFASVVDRSDDARRGFHPMGMADRSGFAAMACDELLIHTADAARGLGREFVPPADLAALVLHRLFPWVSGGEDPWTLLSWANGRIELPGRPRLESWAWHCAPLQEWDGTIPSR